MPSPARPLPAPPSPDALARDILAVVTRGYPGTFAVRLWTGDTRSFGDGPPAFTLVLKHPGSLRAMLWPADRLGLGESYIFDDFDVEGDFLAFDPGTFDFVFGPHIGTWVQPYILGGVGVYDVRFSGTDVIDNITFAQSDTRFGWNAGTGVAFRVSDQSDIHLFLEGRYHSVDLDRDRFFESNNRFEVITVNSGVVF